MAAFRCPAAAIEALTRALCKLSLMNKKAGVDAAHAQLRVGIHTGACMIVR